MAAGFPVKADYATGDVLSAANMNDLSATLNYINPTGKTNGYVLTRNSSATGGLEWAAAGGGGSTGAIQVKSATKSDTFSMSSTTFADVTSLSISITPSSASNKILIIADVNSSIDGNEAYFRFMRDSTAIGLGNSGSGQKLVTFAARLNQNTYNMQSNGMTFLDSPATTSSVTYKLQCCSQDGGTLYINRSVGDRASTNYDARGISSITVMEITA